MPQRIVSIDTFPLDVPLISPFTIATARLDYVNNVAVRVQLESGAEGWGEIPSLYPVTTETQSIALELVSQIAPIFIGKNASEWRSFAPQLLTIIPKYAATRAGIEMAVLDALTNDWEIPLNEFFGGTLNEIITDITIPICTPDEAHSIAVDYKEQGFSTVKTKIGINIREDILRLTAIRDAHPSCDLILDANEGYSAKQALSFLVALRSEGIEPNLLEQPVARDDWEGLGRVTQESNIAVAADESCRSPQDALRISHENLATVINIKLVKCGVVGALEIAGIAQSAGIDLMIGGMVETRIAMGFAAHFAAGLGNFRWIDLDTPLLLAEDPVLDGYTSAGPKYSLNTIKAGHGGWIDIQE